MFNLTEFIHSKRPTLSAGSLKTYHSTISNLFKTLYPGETLSASTIKELNDAPKVIKWLKDNKTEASRKPVLSALSVIFDNDAFRGQMLVDANVLKKDLDKQEMSETTEDNWVTQKEIAQKLTELKKLADAEYKSAQPDLQQIQLYIILVLLGSKYIQPRRAKDYTDFKIRNVTDTDNYIDKGEMVFNSFKTAKTAGQQRIEIPKTLKTILNKWIKKNPTEYLLFDINGQQLSSPQLNQRLNKIFGSTSGKSVNMMRHSFLTEKYGDGIQKKKDLVNDMKAMGSSITEAKFYIESQKGHNGPAPPNGYK